MDDLKYNGRMFMMGIMVGVASTLISHTASQFANGRLSSQPVVTSWPVGFPFGYLSFSTLNYGHNVCVTLFLRQSYYILWRNKRRVLDHLYLAGTCSVKEEHVA